MTGQVTAEQAQQLTSTTRVIVSFGARDGGFELTAQLRQDIMDRYGKRRIIRDPAGKFLKVEADEAFCYLDAITLASAPGTTYDKLKLDKKLSTDPNRAMAIDLNKMANPFWDTYYPAAVANAAVMVFQVTDPWLWSAYCLEELGWFITQALGNLEKGKDSPCIFMVFPDAVEGFKTLLDALRPALKSDNMKALLPHERYARMIDGLAAVENANREADPAAFGRKAALHQRVDRLLNAMKDRVVKVPPGGEAIGFTDYYDAQEQRLTPKSKEEIGIKPANAAYEHRFQYNYSFTSEFQRELFKLLDADLQKVNIWPVPQQ